MFAHLSITTSFASLGSSFSTQVTPRPLVNPQWVAFDERTAELLEMDNRLAYSPEGLAVFSGNTVPKVFDPVAMVYSGHQFGGYSPQLGDGRGLLMGEFQTSTGSYDLHLKGAGKTPYSRFGDGYAVLRSSIREYLASIAMRGLGIPTSHALCLVRGDNPVTRETIEPAAMLARVSRSHIRFGSFEYFYYTEQHEQLRQLADYTIEQYLPDYSNKEGRYNALLHSVVEQTAKLIADWQAVGFCHGVMNTDNMSIVGETLDYGPYGFMEAYNPHHICNHSDHSGRYAYDQQPSIGLWNLNALAAALRPLLNIDQARSSLEAYEGTLSSHYTAKMRKKMGLTTQIEGDGALINEMFEHLEAYQLDYTQFFSQLGKIDTQHLEQSFIIPLTAHLPARPTQPLINWLNKYLDRRSIENAEAAQAHLLRRNNPLYCLRNYYAQQAIEEAYDNQSYTKLNKLAKALADPFSESEHLSEYSKLPPAHLANIAVSCSS